MIDHWKLQRLVDDDEIEELLRLVTLEDVARAWHRHALAYREPAAGLPERDEHPEWWAIELWLTTAFVRHDALVRSGLLALVANAPDKIALSYVGAGPLENFVSANEDDLRWIEEQAATSERFRIALANVWCSDLPEPVFDRLERAAQTTLARPNAKGMRLAQQALLDVFAEAFPDLENVEQHEQEERDADDAVRGEERGVEPSQVARTDQPVLVEEERTDDEDARPVEGADVERDPDGC